MTHKNEAAERKRPQTDKDPIIDCVLTQSIPRHSGGAERRTQLLRLRAETLRSLANRGWRHVGQEGRDYYEGSPNYLIADRLVAPTRDDERPRLYAVN